MSAFGYRVMWDLPRGGNGTKRRFTAREARDVPISSTVVDYRYRTAAELQQLRRISI